MEKKIGKLYSRTHKENRNGKCQIFMLVLLCTGMGKSDKTVSGVVIKNTDTFSDSHVGAYSDSWTWCNDFWEEYKGSVRLDNSNYVELKEIGYAV